MNILIILIITLCFLFQSTSNVLAKFPTKPIEFVLISDGGSTNAIGRLVIEYMKKHINQDVIPITISGAGGSIGANKVKNSKPDGHTIVLGTALAFALIPTLKKNPPFKIITMFLVLLGI